MRTQLVTLAAVGNTAWIPVDNNKAAFGVGIGVMLTPSASLTYTVQHTHDDPFLRKNPVSITRSATTVTVNLPSHGLSVGDFVHVEGANLTSSDVFNGDFSVAAITDANNFTYTVSNAGGATAATQAMVTTLRARPNGSLNSATASGDTNYAFPVRAIRLNISVYTSGTATMEINQGDAV